MMTLFEIQRLVVSYMYVVSVMFVFRREKLSLRDKKKRKKRVVTVGRYSV